VRTELLEARDPSAIARAIELLRAGEVVAVPTETVYGLAADALNPDAALRIFEAKERPKFDPLIVHLPGPEWLDRITTVSAEDRKLVQVLIGRFWPGPLTLVLPKKPIVPDVVTAGLGTVAVRLSSHPVLREILEQLDRPLAAPSANRFGRISPTEARHVLSELEGRIPLIIDAGPTSLGLESTVIAIKRGRGTILRKGPILAEELSQLPIDQKNDDDERIVSPGQLPSHYAPRTRLRLIKKADEAKWDPTARVGLLRYQESGENVGKFAVVRTLSATGDLSEAATNLFRILRELDASDVDLILAEEVPEQGLGAAIMDRLRRAAAE
jgi:L-threonylcarbamoyladenylate synthase